MIKIRLLSENSKSPIYEHKGDAGMDIFSNEYKELDVGCRQLVNTGISIEIPYGYYGRISAKSGLCMKGIDIGAGVIDYGYTGEIKVFMFNNGQNKYIVNMHDKIAQLIVEKIIDSPILVIYDKDWNKIDEKKYEKDYERSDKGFGSTGLI